MKREAGTVIRRRGNRMSALVHSKAGKGKALGRARAEALGGRIDRAVLRLPGAGKGPVGLMYESEGSSDEEIRRNARVVGYRFSYLHHHKGVPVAGDFVNVIVRADGVECVVANWHELREVRPRPVPLPVTREAAAGRARGKAARQPAPAGRPGAADAELCYYAFHAGASEQAELRIAWRVAFEGHHGVYYVDAENGELLDQYLDEGRSLGRRKGGVPGR